MNAMPLVDEPATPDAAALSFDMPRQAWLGLFGVLLAQRGFIIMLMAAEAGKNGVI